MCCPLPILGPGQAGDGVRLHSGQGQMRLLGRHVSFTPYLCVCTCECGPAYLCTCGLYLCVCVCMAARLCLSVCVCTCMCLRVLHVCTTHMHTCALVCVPPISRPRHKDSIARRWPQIAKQGSEEEGGGRKAASEGRGLQQNAAVGKCRTWLGFSQPEGRELGLSVHQLPSSLIEAS